MKKDLFPIAKLYLLFFILISFPLALRLFNSFRLYIKQAAGKPANIIVDAGSSYSVSKFVWQNFSQGGEEKTQMLAPVVKNMKKLEPQYVRIDHVYDFYDVVGRDDGGQLTFNWEKLDLTVNDILEMGAKPFFSLSYMPSVLSLGTEVDLPINWSEWKIVVQETVSHYSGKNSYAISDAYYEIWNEPDLFGNFKTYGSKNYLDLYFYAAKGAMAAENVYAFKIGGPATTQHYKNWLVKMFDFARKNNIWFDFYSWHRYSDDINKFEDEIGDLKRLLNKRKDVNNIELIISEYGPYTQNNKTYDNNISAIHTMAASALMENEIDKAFVFEVKDGLGDKKYWGRFGLLTNEAFGEPEEKPRYKAFEFLNSMKGKKVNIAGQGTWIKAFAKEDDGVIRLLVVNYDLYDKNFESVPVNFINLGNGKYMFRRIDFLGGERKDVVSVDSGNLQIYEHFSPNTAAIFELIPQ